MSVHCDIILATVQITIVTYKDAHHAVLLTSVLCHYNHIKLLLTFNRSHLRCETSCCADKQIIGILDPVC